MKEKSTGSPLTQEARRYLLAKRELEQINQQTATLQNRLDTEILELEERTRLETNLQSLKAQYSSQSDLVHGFSPDAIAHATMIVSAMTLIDELEAGTDTPELLDELIIAGDTANDVAHRLTTDQADADPAQLQKDNEQRPERNGMFTDGEDL